MRPVEVVPGAVCDIAVPALASRMAGVHMAGFQGRATSPIDFRVIPYPALTVFLTVGDITLVDGSGAREGGGVVVGLASGGVRGCGRGQVDCLQLRLSPVVAHAVLGVGPELGGTVVALEQLWGRDALRIREQLYAAGSWEDRFAIAKAALTRRSEAGHTVAPEVAYCWERMVRNRGRVRVEGLAAEIGWSRKRLWSRFRSQVGLTPKQAANLVRFDHAVHRLAAGHAAARVAADTGYADQPHLHRDVMAFTGLTTTAAAVAPWLAVDDVAWAGREHISAR
ncbi:helix-turn-helix domain-containing protein [Nocardia sp. NPDC051030]|uniref:helix-turn-helix domain-containing protein n=1 Tax=Nocardia sp. NPDC051030 TaxID=3155162 RepID=UPI003437AD56